jgi:phosphoribosylamine--glycine ligase
MNVLLIGSGGREHAIAYKIKQSPLLNRFFILPGNPGTSQLGKNIILKADDHQAIIDFCTENKVDLIVIGPEKPLVDGLADSLRGNGFFVFGSDAKAAEIEAHKSFAKYLMKKYKIPTAGYAEFTSNQLTEAEKYLKVQEYPCVIKADGLAAGKGVIICNDFNEAKKTLEDMFIKRIFGTSGEKIIIEDYLNGEEASILVVTDGEDFICLPSSQDHKRIGDNDTGKNTGGMGAYSPAPIVTKEILHQVEEEIIKPTLRAMREEGRKFNGCLYCGLMLTKDGPKVIEYNCRFGDPETQAVLPLLEGDFLQLLYSAAKGKLDKNSVSYSGGASVCVVVASRGYPDSFEKGFEISGLDMIDPDIIIYHAGTAEKNGKVISNGGRVLGVTSFFRANDLHAAKEKAYEAVKKINFKNIYYRTDIAAKALK